MTDGYIDYYFNYALSVGRGTFDSSGECFNGSGRVPALDSELEQPALTVLLLDGASGAAFNSMTGPVWRRLASDGQAAPRRHLGGSNFAFTDGPVKWYRDNERFAQSEAVYSMCNTFADSGQSPTFHFKDFE